MKNDRFLKIKHWLNKLEGMSTIESEREPIDPGDQKRAFIKSIVNMQEEDPKEAKSYKDFITSTYKNKGPLTAKAIEKKVKR